jgi:hypothetical protein
MPWTVPWMQFTTGLIQQGCGWLLAADCQAAGSCPRVSSSSCFEECQLHNCSHNNLEKQCAGPALPTLPIIASTATCRKLVSNGTGRLWLQGRLQPLQMS